MRTWFKGLLLGIGACLILIQLVPYGRPRSNPPVVSEPAWSSASARALAVRACFDCHSNETRWPWYAHVAPVSWLVTHDVEEGRRVFNVSEWHRPQPEAVEAAETVIKGEMPLAYYVVMHPEALLSAAERQELIDGLLATFGQGDAGEHRDTDEND